MNYYRIPIPDECPECKTRLVIDLVGMSAEWSLAANYHCPKCKQGGGQEFDICEMIAWCREKDGTLLS